MSASSTIVYLKRKDIDVERWDACIQKSENGLIYAYSYYLDAMCTNWDALVMGDYEMVMPLPWRKKWGVRYLYTPAFIQQLGVIGTLEGVNYEAVVKKIQQHFAYGDYTFNSTNIIQGFAAAQRTNFLLHLNDSFEDPQKQFSADLKRNLRISEKYLLQIDPTLQLETVISTFKDHYGSRIPHVTETDYANFLSLCTILDRKGQIFTRITRSHRNNIEACALCLLAKGRVYNMLNVTTETGREKSANHYLLAEIIKEFSGQNFILDFEGSDLPGVKEFYQNFNPTNEPYFLYHFNNLPFPLNILKK